MLYIAIDRHKDQDCPGRDPEAMKKLASRFSKAYLSKKNVKIIDGFIDHSCMLQTTDDHMCAFVIESDLPPSTLSEMFRPLILEVWSVVRWQGFESKIKQTKLA